MNIKVKNKEKLGSSLKSIEQCIKYAYKQIAYSDIYPLLSFATGKSKEFIFTHSEYLLKPKEYLNWVKYLKRRKSGEPVAYITGNKEFYSLNFEVTRDTLIPRPETEILVEEVIKLSPKKLLDIGTGCGNIAITVKYFLRNCEVLAVDISDRALKVAEKNAQKIAGKNNIRFLVSDFFKDIPDEKYNVIASNPPYIKTSRLPKLQKEVRDFEPELALNGGEDGLSATKSILNGAKKYLEPGGRLVLETDNTFLKKIKELTLENGFFIERIVKDFAGMDRVLVIKTSEDCMLNSI